MLGARASYLIVATAGGNAAKLARAAAPAAPAAALKNTRTVCGPWPPEILKRFEDEKLGQAGQSAALAAVWLTHILVVRGAAPSAYMESRTYREEVNAAPSLMTSRAVGPAAGSGDGAGEEDGDGAGAGEGPAAGGGASSWMVACWGAVLVLPFVSLRSR
jgi:hypothetical protein